MYLPTEVVISVIQKDIDTGVQCEPGDCPIAHAVLRRFAYTGKVASVAVSPTEVVMYDEHDHLLAEYALPLRAARFVRAFDGFPQSDPGLVKPHHFTLTRKDVSEYV